MSGPGLSIHRSEALTDGIYAVAMTLLVIDLKLPDGHSFDTSMSLLQGIADLTPKFIAWIISFAVLGIFWFGHHRVFEHVRQVDGRLVVLNLMQLACVTLMPFCCALAGEHARLLVTQAFYSGLMSALSLSAWLTTRHLYVRPQMASHPITSETYAAIRMRLFGLVVLSGAAVVLNALLPGFGNCAFMLMWPLGMISRRMEARASRHAP